MATTDAATLVAAYRTAARLGQTDVMQRTAAELSSIVRFEGIIIAIELEHELEYKTKIAARKAAGEDVYVLTGLLRRSQRIILRYVRALAS